MPTYKRAVSDLQAKAAPGKFFGITVSTTTGGSFAIYDSDRGSTSDPKIIDTVAAVAGVTYMAIADGVRFDKGLFIDATGAISYTVVFD